MDSLLARVLGNLKKTIPDKKVMVDATKVAKGAVKAVEDGSDSAGVADAALEVLGEVIKHAEDVVSAAEERLREKS
jgi:hypothetical protein